MGSAAKGVGGIGARPREQSERDHRDDAHGGELPHPVDPCLEQVPGCYRQESSDGGSLFVVAAQEAAGTDSPPR